MEKYYEAIVYYYPVGDYKNWGRSATPIIRGESALPTIRISFGSYRASEASEARGYSNTCSINGGGFVLADCLPRGLPRGSGEVGLGIGSGDSWSGFYGLPMACEGYQAGEGVAGGGR